jgi:hypothetical protein
VWLAQTRQCDGQCCKDQPQFPADGVCRYFTEEPLPGGHCRAMHDITVLDDEHIDHFLKTCRWYPHDLNAGRNTLNCCWKWHGD